MPFKRLASQSESSSSHPPLPKQRKTTTLAGVSIFLIQAKLEASEVRELLGLAEQHSHRVCKTPGDADIIVTAIRMRRRLERHVPWTVAVSPAPAAPIRLSLPPDALVLAMSAELKSSSNTSVASRLCGGGEASALRGLCCGWRPSRHYCAKLSRLRTRSLHLYRVLKFSILNQVYHFK